MNKCKQCDAVEEKFLTITLDDITPEIPVEADYQTDEACATISYKFSDDGSIVLLDISAQSFWAGDIEELINFLEVLRENMAE